MPMMFREGGRNKKTQNPGISKKGSAQKWNHILTECVQQVKLVEKW